MARTMNTESIVESVIRSWLNELYISGLDKITILRVFPIKPNIPLKIKWIIAFNIIRILKCI